MKTYNLTKKKLITKLVIIILFSCSYCFADAGMPVIFGVELTFLFLIIPIILIETFFLKISLKINFKKIIFPTIIANLVSTLLGYPLAWSLLLLLQFNVLNKIKIPDTTSFVNIIIYGITNPGWIYANGKVADIAIPTAYLINIIISFLVSVYFEYLIIKSLLEKYGFKFENKIIKRLSLEANAISYGFLIICFIIFAIFIK